MKELDPKVIRRRRGAVGGCAVDKDGDGYNLAIVLCLYFSDHPHRPDDDPDDEFGWGEWVLKKTNEALDLIAEEIFVDPMGDS